jgi:hypothetical protein
MTTDTTDAGRALASGRHPAFLGAPALAAAGDRPLLVIGLIAAGVAVLTGAAARRRLVRDERRRRAVEAAAACVAAGEALGALVADREEADAALAFDRIDSARSAVSTVSVSPVDEATRSAAGRASVVLEQAATYAAGAGTAGRLEPAASAAIRRLLPELDLAAERLERVGGDERSADGGTT